MKVLFPEDVGVEGPVRVTYSFTVEARTLEGLGAAAVKRAGELYADRAYRVVGLDVSDRFRGTTGRIYAAHVRTEIAA